MRCLAALAILSLSAPAFADKWIATPEAAREPAPRLALTIGFGAGGLTGGSSASMAAVAAGEQPESFSQGVSIHVGEAFRVTDQMWVLFNGEYTAFARYRPDPTLAQQQGVVTLGVGFQPFADGKRIGRIALDPKNLSLKLAVGAAHLIQVPYGDLDPFAVRQGEWGPALTGGVGWFPLRTPGWELGFEASDSVGFYASGPRHNMGLNLVARLLML